jgi:hypothetical protein
MMVGVSKACYSIGDVTRGKNEKFVCRGAEKECLRHGRGCLCPKI